MEIKENEINTGIDIEKQKDAKTNFRPIENIINSGLDLEKQELDLISNPKLFMGAVSNFPIIKEDADWMNVWLQLTPETQFGAKLETMGCTGYGTSNILEMIWLWKFNKVINISDRALNKMSGTTRQGNSVDAPIDTIRHQGFLLEEEWSWDRETFDWDNYYAAIPNSLLNKAKKRLNEWEFEHEYISTYDKNGIIEALKTSPIAGTVAAWYRGENGFYYDYGYKPNHMTVVIVGYKLNEYWICADSYPEDFNFKDNPTQQEFIKKLDWNYRFGSLKRYKISAKTNVNTSLLSKLKRMFKNLVAYMDSHGLHIWYIDERGKQEIPLETMAEKALFMSYVKEGIIKTTSYPIIAPLPNFKFF